MPERRRWGRAGEHLPATTIGSCRPLREVWPDEEWCEGCGFAISGTYCEVCAEPDYASEEYIAWARNWVWRPVNTTMSATAEETGDEV
jgi:hypothetical protein